MPDANKTVGIVECGVRAAGLAFTTLKIAVLAPMPSASVITATAAKPGLLRSWRRLKRKILQ